MRDADPSGQDHGSGSRYGAGGVADFGQEAEPLFEIIIEPDVVPYAVMAARGGAAGTAAAAVTIGPVARPAATAAERAALTVTPPPPLHEPLPQPAIHSSVFSGLVALVKVTAMVAAALALSVIAYQLSRDPADPAGRSPGGNGNGTVARSAGPSGEPRRDREPTQAVRVAVAPTSPEAAPAAAPAPAVEAAGTAAATSAASLEASRAMATAAQTVTASALVAAVIDDAPPEGAHVAATVGPVAAPEASPAPAVQRIDAGVLAALALAAEEAIGAAPSTAEIEAEATARAEAEAAAARAEAAARLAAEAKEQERAEAAARAGQAREATDAAGALAMAIVDGAARPVAPTPTPRSAPASPAAATPRPTARSASEIADLTATARRASAEAALAVDEVADAGASTIRIAGPSAAPAAPTTPTAPAAPAAAPATERAAAAAVPVAAPEGAELARLQQRLAELMAGVESREATPERLAEAAMLAYDVGDRALARRLYERLIAIDPLNGRALNNLAVLAIEDGDGTRAEALLKEAIALAPSPFAPSTADAYVNLGNLYLERGDARIAELNYRSALKARPGFSLARLHLARALERGARLADAAAELEVLRASLPGGPPGAGAGAGATDPLAAEVEAVRGRVALKRGRLPEAEQALRLAIQLSQGEARARAESDLASCLARLGRHKEARALLDRLLAARPEDARLLVQRGLVGMAEGDHRAARADLDRALALAPDMADAHYDYALLAEHYRNYSFALEAYERVIEIEPSHAPALTNLGRLYLVSARKAGEDPARRLEWARKALDYLNRATFANPELAEAHYNRGLTLIVLNRRVEAASALERYLDLLPPGAARDAKVVETLQQLKGGGR